MGSCGDDEDGSAEMGGEQDDWMWVCVGWSRGVLWLVRRECVVWFFFFVFGFWGVILLSGVWFVFACSWW